MPKSNQIWELLPDFQPKARLPSIETFFFLSVFCFVPNLLLQAYCYGRVLGPQEENLFLKIPERICYTEDVLLMLIL